MMTLRPKTQVEAAKLLLATLDYAATTEEDFAFGPLTVEGIVRTGFTVTPLTEDLSRILRQLVDAGELDN